MLNQMYTEEYRSEWSLEILKLLMRRKEHLAEILRITKEFSEALERNDGVTLRMLLEMREKELILVDEVLNETSMLRSQLMPQAQKEIEVLFEGGSVDNPTLEMEKISVAVMNCRKILQDIITIDKRMSRKVAGEDSFYEK